MYLKKGKTKNDVSLDTYDKVKYPWQSPVLEAFREFDADHLAEKIDRGDRRSSTSKRVRETEAEATAFVVNHAMGLETGSAASDYIQLWNGDVQVLPESLGYIRQAASQIISALTDT